MKTLLLALALGALALPARAAALPESQKIDDLLMQDWQKNNLKPNPPATDEVLVRRLYLDILGRIPTVEETQDFVKSNDPQKRVKLIDRLLGSDGYTSNMYNFWADILRLTDNVKGKVTAQAYAEYVKRCLKENKPYDQFVRDLLTTDGGVWDSGSIGFYMRDENKLDHLAYTVQVFLGTSIVCAQCHNHPFDKWSQMDYYGMAAFTYGMDTKGYGDGLNFKRKGAKELAKATPEALKGMTKQERQKYLKEHQDEMKKMREEEANTQKDLAKVRDVMKDIMKPLRYTSIRETDKLPALPHDYKYADAKPNQVIQPKTIFGHDALPANGETRLDAFAKWMTSPENPRFTTVIANRMWKRVFGMGLIEPVDEMTDSTVASNPQLMDYLTQLMTDKKYSLKSFLRVLYNTAAYQRMASTNEVPLGETYHFTGPLLRRMSAEQIWDSMVTLSKGNVDAATSEENDRLHDYLGDLKGLMDTLKEKGPEGLVEIARRGADQREANQKKLAELREEAKAAKDTNPSAAKALSEEANRLRKTSTNDMLVAILGEEGARDLKQGYAGKKRNNKVEVVDRKALAALSKEERKSALAMASNFNINTRASELPSPERPGHFLRTFGQSDRELISNASDDASVPQALALLNGPAADALAGPLSFLHQELNKAATPAEKMDLLYVAFLSRHPSREERAVLDQVIRDRGDKALADVTHALLTGSQFLFIQ